MRSLRQATMSLERKEDESSHDDDPCLSDNKVKDETAPFLSSSTSSLQSINFQITRHKPPHDQSPKDLILTAIHLQKRWPSNPPPATRSTATQPHPFSYASSTAPTAP